MSWWPKLTTECDTKFSCGEHRTHAIPTIVHFSKGWRKIKRKKREMEPCMHLPKPRGKEPNPTPLDPPPKLMPDGHPVFCHVSFFLSNLSLFPFFWYPISFNHVCVSFKKNTYLRKILCINVILWLNTLTETINNLEIWYMEFVILDLRKLLKN